MNKTNKTNEANKGGAGAPFAIGERECARVERWRGLIANRLAQIEGNAAHVPVAWLEEIEQRPMLDVLTERIARKRLTGDGQMTESQQIDLKFNREMDEYYEGRGTRARNNHEDETVYMLVHFATLNMPSFIPDERQREFVRRFYRAGDNGLTSAVRRAVCAAMDSAREAERNANGDNARRDGRNAAETDDAAKMV